MSSRGRRLVELALDKSKDSNPTVNPLVNNKSSSFLKDETDISELVNAGLIIADQVVTNHEPLLTPLISDTSQSPLIVNEILVNFNSSDLGNTDHVQYETDCNNLNVALLTTEEIDNLLTILPATQSASTYFANNQQLRVNSPKPIDHDNVDDPDYVPSDDTEDDEEPEDGKEVEKAEEYEESKEVKKPKKNNESLGSSVELECCFNEASDNASSTKRSKRSRPETWKRNETKIKRMKGQNYIGYTRTRDGRVTHEKQRPARMSLICNSEHCLKNRRYCTQFSKDYTEQIFSKFWDLSWEQKKVYVCTLVDYAPKKRAYTDGPSRRSGTFIYHLKKENQKLQVCKKMFLGTLGLKEKMVQSWIKSSEAGIIQNVPKVMNRQLVQRNDTRTIHLKQFFDSLPKQPSHYCRKDSSKVYLEQTFRTKSQIYSLYKEKCQQDSVKPYTLYPFCCVFEELKLSIFKPRKDECDTCYAYKTKQISENEYNIHIAKKDRARSEKVKNKDEAVQNLVYTFTMDTQAVKLCPALNVSASYYKTKLQIHNFTVYNLQSHQCTNYLWNETEGDLSASVFTTCIIEHLRINCLSDKKPIILFSDGCGYQNRNVVLSNALLHFAIQHNVVIEQKFLEKGHTQMECDSVHAMIERKLKQRVIQLPSEYMTAIREARTKPTPLDVKYLTFETFLNYDEKSTFIYNSIRPGKVLHDPTVSNLRALKYAPEGKIFYKLDFNDDYIELPQRARKVNKTFRPQKLFDERLKIKYSKWMHLQQLKNYLTADTHEFYNSIPHLTQ